MGTGKMDRQIDRYGRRLTKYKNDIIDKKDKRKKGEGFTKSNKKLLYRSMDLSLFR